MKNLTLTSRFVGTQSTTLSEEELAWKCNKANLINMKINNFSSILYEYILNLLRLFLGGEVYQFICTFSGEYKKYKVMELWGGALNRTPRGFDLSKCVVKFSFLEMIIHHYEPLGHCVLFWISLQSLIVSFVLDVMAAWYEGSDVMRLLSLLLLLLPLSSYLQCCWALHCSSSPYATQVCVILKQYRNFWEGHKK